MRTNFMANQSQLLFVIFFYSISCSYLLNASIESEPLNPISSEVPAKLFRKMTPEDTGISFKNYLKDENIKKYLYNGAGVTVGDYDNDGLPDIYLVSQDGKNKLFRQRAPWQFEDVTEKAGVDGGDAWGTGATFVDIDNDGDLDLYVCNFAHPNLLYINQADGTFSEEAAKWKLDYKSPTEMAAFADYDRDGDLDCYLLNYRVFPLHVTHPKITLQTFSDTQRVHPDQTGETKIINGHMNEAGRKDRLLKNNGDGTFSNASYSSNVGQDANHGLSATWWDYNNDNWPDLYVANDFKNSDHLYRNNGDGTFTDIIKQSMAYTSWFAMGGDFGDINNDGYFDYLVADMSATNHYKEKTMMGAMSKSRWFLESAEPRQYMRNTLQLNAGTGRFMEVGYLSGVASTDWTWSARLVDLDNDGFVDAFFSNGVERNFNDSDTDKRTQEFVKRRDLEGFHRELLALPRQREKNRAYRNRGDLTFEETSSTWGLDDGFVTHGAVFSDLDRDGDLDLIINNMNDPVGVYRNDGISGGRILIRLKGKQSNSSGVGSRITAVTQEETQSRLLSLARGYLSADEPLIHFGFGTEAVIQRLIVEWPSGAMEEFKDLPTGRFYTITEPEGKFTPEKPKKEKKSGQFAEIAKEMGLRHRHQENEFDDYKIQELLPFKMSRLGPGMAWSDVDGDGLQDLFVGGAVHQSGTLFFQQEDGEFEREDQCPWEEDAESEDLGALWFDSDGDSDLDLYVVSGGYEYDQGDGKLQDRLYINEGNRNFKKAPTGVLPEIKTSGSVVVGSDFDRDGDVDLFVGSRLISGKYPLSPKHSLLINSVGKFKNEVETIAPDLVQCGNVTSAVWSDIDNDHWMDLIVTTEWGPVRVFRNQEGKLAEATDLSGLANYLGFWNGIAAGDIDNDGDMDFVATNLGLNSKYHPTSEKPLHLYASDFDENGEFDLVEAKWEDETLYPVRGKSCSADAMPFVGEKFGTYNDFALASLEEIYTSSALEGSTEFTVNYLESSVFINDGSGKFAVHALPKLAQVAPGFGVVFEDLTGDGKLDIVLAQNFYSPQPETGRMSGGLSLLLEGKGDGTFKPIWPKESGIIVPEDAKSLAVVDVDGDRIKDLVFGINNGYLKVYRNSMPKSVHAVTLSLSGRQGNPQAFGARVILSTSKERVFHREVYGGSGYLSQSSSTIQLFFEESEFLTSVEVFWPDGKTSKFDSIPVENVVTLRHPSIKLASAEM